MKKEEKVSFEQALDATGFGIFNIAMLLLCSCMTMAMIFESLSISFIVSTSACELKTSSVEQGFMAGSPLFGIIATSHIWGYLADTRGRRKILLLTLVLGFIPGMLSAFAPNWIILCVLKLCSCSAMSGTFSLTMTLLSESTPKKNRTALLLLSGSVMVASNGVMAVMALPILPLTFSYHIGLLGIYFNSWRLLCMLFSMPLLLCLIGMYFSIESPKYLMNAGLEDEALAVLKKIYVLNKGKDDGGFQVKSIYLEEGQGCTQTVGLWKSIKSQSIPIMKPPLLKNTLVLSFLFLGIYMCVNPYLIWLPTMADAFMRSYEQGETGASICQMIRIGSSNKTDFEAESCTMNDTAMLVIMAEAFLFAVINTMLSGVIKVYGRKRLLITIQLLSGITGLCINLITQNALSAVLFIIYLSPTLGMSIITTFTVDIYPTQLRAMAVCLTVMVGRGGSIFGVNLLKELLRTNCELSFYLFSSVTLMCAAVACYLPADERTKKKIEEC